jgi:pimeloyl-ACP methyl ester carboxylesterase
MRVHGTDLHYEDTGGSGEPILFLHGFLFDGRQYEAQVAVLRDRYRCLTLDFRGQGRSATPGGYQIEQHTADVLAVIRERGIAPVHLVGLSMGGFVGLRIAAREPGLLRSLVLLNSSAAAHARTKIAKHLVLSGVGRVVGVSPPRLLARIEAEMYGAAFRADPARAAERDTWRGRWAESDRAALTKTLQGIMFRPDIRGELSDITVPTLIIAGGSDASLPPEQSREMHRLIAGSRLVELPGVGHSSPVESPEQVTRVLTEFLGSVQAGAQGPSNPAPGTA